MPTCSISSLNNGIKYPCTSSPGTDQLKCPVFADETGLPYLTTFNIPLAVGTNTAVQCLDRVPIKTQLSTGTFDALGSNAPQLMELTRGQPYHTSVWCNPPQTIANSITINCTGEMLPNASPTRTYFKFTLSAPAPV
jgi:hypothetical protein